MRVYVGLGSNLGDRLANLQRAVDALRAIVDVEVTRTSSVYETDPVGPEQPDFLNAVVELETNVPPHELLDHLKRIEAEVGRIQREHWGPRDVDLDLLLYGDSVIEEPDLKVPHPMMHVRAFVVVPLRELDPSLAGDIGVDGVRRTDLSLS